MIKTYIAGRHTLRLRHAVQRRLRNHFRSEHTNSKTSPAPPTKTASAGDNAAIAPRPSWAYLYPLAAPLRAYGRMQNRSPYMTQLSSSLIIYFVGDLSAQLVAYTPPTPPESVGAEARQDYMYAPERGLRAMIIGGISSIPSYHWFLFLGRHFNYSSHALSIAVKIVVNQTFFTPVFNSYFFGMQSLLSGQGWEETKRRVKDTVPRSWRMSWCLWPAVTALNFTWVRPQYRSTAAGVVAIGWQTYLSWLNSQAARKSQAEKEATDVKAPKVQKKTG